MDRDLILEEERLDDLEIGNLFLIQNPQKFSFGIDAVLLSAFAARKIKEREHILDIGTGTGILPLLLHAKTKAGHICGLEIQEDMARMARRSVAYNGIDNIEIVHGDIKEYEKLFPKGSFDSIVSNPPYMNEGKPSPNENMAISRHELACTLEDIIQSATYLLKPGGKFFMVHRPNRLVDILSLMRQKKLEPKCLKMVQPFAGAKPNLLLIEGMKGGGSWLSVEENLIVYEAPGVYTKEIVEIYGKDDKRQ